MRRVARRAILRCSGVACFGPIDLQPSSPTYGYITTTPKPGWQNVDVLGPLRAVRDVPFGFDIDAECSCGGEHAFAVAEAVKAGKTPPSSCCYITVGTGIGVGLVINNAPVHGLMHPEGGHVCVHAARPMRALKVPTRPIALVARARRICAAASR